MANPYFQFKQFVVFHDRCGMKVTTDACLFGSWLDHPQAQHVLDIGSGSGLLSLMFAQRHPTTRIHAVEIDPNAFEQSSDNVQKSPFANQIQVFNSAIQEYTSDTRYDLIICNPPFFPDHLKSKHPQKLQALHTDSLSFQDLLMSVQRLMHTHGELQLLFPERQYIDFKKLAAQSGLLASEEVRIYNHLGKSVFRIMAKMHFASTECVQKSIIIYQSDGSYTEDFKKYLSRYYLHL